MADHKINGLGARVMDEFLSGISALAVVAFAVWFCWDGGSAWNDEKYVFLAQSKNCNAVGICDLNGPENLTSFKISVNKVAGSVVFFNASGRIMREERNCIIADKDNFRCSLWRDEMAGDRFVTLDYAELNEKSGLQELSPAAWRINWVISHFEHRAASSIEELLN